MRMVALHGFLGSGADFDPLAARLEIPVFAPDLPQPGTRRGTGPGRASEPHRMSVRAERIATQVGDGAVVLLGYSLGGRVASGSGPSWVSAWPGWCSSARIRASPIRSSRARRMAADHAPRWAN